jgi:integrase
MSKRGQNEGSIFEERPGRWVASISLGYEVKEGRRRRIRKKFTATSRRDVQKKLTEALREQQTGGAVPIQKETLGAFLGTWLSKLEQKGRTERTIESYDWLIEKHIAPELGHIALTKITQRDINDFMSRKLNSGLSPRTVAYCHAVIRSALSRAEKDGLVSRNVAKLADPPAASTGAQIEPLSPVDASKFLAAVAGHRLEAMYSVALAIGLRRGEALALAWRDVDLTAGTVLVRATLQRIRTRKKAAMPGAKKSRLALTDDTKGRKARLIPLPTFAAEALQRHHQNQNRERQFAGEQWKESGLVFTSTVGTPLEPRNVVRQFHSLLDAVKIPRHRFHDLRHTAASLLLAQGATLHDVKEILGHSQIALTANLYGHAYTSVLRESVDRVGSLLAPLNPVAPSVAPLSQKSANRKGLTN